MAALQQLFNQTPRGVWMNVNPSTAITSTSETAFDQQWTMQSQSETTVAPNTVITFYARGIYSTVALLPSLTVRLRLNSLTGPILGQTSSSPVISSASNAAWSFTGSIFMRGTGATGSLEFQ